MSDKLKKLTGKNPKDFEPVAYSLINNSDTELFSELVSQEDFLFEFIKQNVAQRLSRVCNESNYMNLISFLKYYSPSYEEFIVSTLANFADEDLTDRMLEIFENGTVDEKTYCAKFFAYIQDPLAIELLNKYAYSDNGALSSNCASTLCAMGDKNSYNSALDKLNSNDDFDKLDAVKFLVSYGEKDAVETIITAMKNSAFAENIAGEILYLADFFTIYKQNRIDGLYILNLIINGLGEILNLSQVFDFQLYEIFEYLKNAELTSETAVVLLNAKDKFNTLTENDEYLFDESKDVKQEVVAIKELLSKIPENKLEHLANNELKDDSLFVFTALEILSDTDKIRELLTSSNQTIVLKAIEVLKRLNSITVNDKETALNFVEDENIKGVIMALTKEYE